MIRFRPLIIMASLLFLLIEVWEPSTSFVRAAVLEKISTNSIKDTRAREQSPARATLAAADDATTKVQLLKFSAPVSHSSTVFTFAGLAFDLHVISNFSSPQFFGHDGTYFMPRRPPIFA